jgi:hypothetical protein
MLASVKPIRWLRFLLIGLTIVISLFAHVKAQGDFPAGVEVAEVQASERPVNVGLVNQSVNDAIAAFKNLIAIANNAIKSIQTNSTLKSYGKRLTLMLASIVIIWAILKNIALKQSFPQLVGDLIFPLVIAGFVLTAGLDMLPGVIEGVVKSVAGVFGAGTETMENTFAAAMFKSIGDVWGAEKAGSGLWNAITAPISSVAMLIFKIGVVLIMLMATALGVAAILVAKFQIALAIALAGLFIPWIMFKPTEFLFSGWLNFFLKAGFGLVGIFAVGAVVQAGALGLATMIPATTTDLAGVLTYAAMAGMSVIFAYLMLKASDIGEGLVGGSATGIGQLSSVAKGSAASSPGKMAGAAVGGVGSAGRVAAGALAGKAMQGPPKLSRAQASAVSAAFGKEGSIARTMFEKARGEKVASPSAPRPTATPPSPSP